MKKNILLFLVFCLSAILAFISISDVKAQTVDATAAFDASLSGQKLLYAAVKVNDVNENDVTDVVFALSEPEITAWESYSAAVRFAGGRVDVRDGGAFATPVTHVPVEFNTLYHIWVSVDVPGKTYTTWLKTDAMPAPVLIYENAAFRKTDISALNRWSALHNPANEPDVLSVETVRLIEESPANAKLAAVMVNEGALEPVFDPSVTAYEITVPVGTSSLEVSAVPEMPASTVEGRGPVDVSSGNGTATLVVTAPDGTTTKTYNLNITVESLSSGANYAISLPGGSNGANSNVAIPALNLKSLPVTVEMWYKPESNQNNYATLWYNRGASDNAGFQYDRWTDQSKVKAVWNGAAGIPEVKPVPGEWNHMALVLTPNSKTFYVNGVPTTETGTAFQLFPFDGTTYLGWDNAVADRTLKGLIDEVRIWNSARTAEELENARYTRLTGDESGLIGYWNFDDRAAVATDFSGGGKHGTINGGTYTASSVFDQMEYVQSTVARKEDFVGPGATDKVVMIIEVETRNSLNPLLLSKIALSASGTTALSDIRNVRVYSAPQFTEENLVAQSEGPPAGESFELTADYPLKGGKNQFWITYSVSDAAAEGNVLDGAVSSITLVGGETKTYIPAIISGEGSLTVNPHLFVDFQKLAADIVTTEAATSVEGSNFASFQQDAIMTYNGYQYLTFWDKGANLSIARKRLPEGEWEIINFADYRVSPNRVADNHYTISMGICENDGTIHIAFDHHNDPLHYKKSVPGLANNPEEIDWTQSSFGGTQNFLLSGEPVNNITYPRFVSKPDGDLLFETRIGWSGDGDSFLWEYSGETGTWEYIGEYLNGTSVGENAYINGIHYDPNGRLHVSWIWRGTPDPRTNHDVYYGYSDDDGRTWYNAAGTQVGVVNSNPMGLNSPGLKVWTVRNNRGLINQESQAVDSKGRIHILQSYMRDEEPDNSNFWGSRINQGYLRHIYQDESGNWKNDVIARSGRNRSEIALDARDNLYVVTADYRIYFAAAADGWKNWTELDISESGISMNEVLIDRNALLKEDVLSFVYAHRDKDGKIVVPYYLLEKWDQGTGEGLNITVFDDTSWGRPVSQVLDKVDINSDDVEVSGEDLGIRYSGTIETKYAEAYTLYLTTSGATKVWINDELAIETGELASATEFQTSLELLPGHKYRIRMEGLYSSSTVSTKLEWSSQSQEREIIPITALYGELEDIELYPPIIDAVEKGVADFVHCFPNPSEDTFTIKAPGAFAYQVFDISGRLVEIGKGTDSCELGGKLRKGIYLLKVIQKAQYQSIKIIRQ